MPSQGITPDAKACRDRRIACGLTQEQLADESGLSKATIERIEKGESKTISTLNLVAKALSVSVEELLPNQPTSKKIRPSKRSRTEKKGKKAFRIRGGAPGAGSKLVGRDNDLSAIREKLEQSINDQTAGIVVVQGVGGVGKSSIVHHLAYDQSFAELFPNGCFWAGVGNSPDVLQSLTHWAQAAKVESGSLLRINDVVAALRAKLHDRKVLLLVDDLWHLPHAEAFRVAGPGSAILYTTRLPQLAKQLAQNVSMIYALLGLETDKGLDLLAQFAPEVVAEHRELCEQLIESVEGLPLAISVAGRLLHREFLDDEDVEDVIAAIRDDSTKLLNEPVPADMVNLLDQTTPHVAAVLQRSLTGLSQEERRLFGEFCMFPEAPVRWTWQSAMITWKLSEKVTKATLKRFAEFGLIEKSSPGYYRIHPLMRALSLHEGMRLYEGR